MIIDESIKIIKVIHLNGLMDGYGVISRLSKIDE